MKIAFNSKPWSWCLHQCNSTRSISGLGGDTLPLRQLRLPLSNKYSVYDRFLHIYTYKRGWYEDLVEDSCRRVRHVWIIWLQIKLHNDIPMSNMNNIFLFQPSLPKLTFHNHKEIGNLSMFSQEIYNKLQLKPGNLCVLAWPM